MCAMRQSVPWSAPWLARLLAVRMALVVALAFIAPVWQRSGCRCGAEPRNYGLPAAVRQCLYSVHVCQGTEKAPCRHRWLAVVPKTRHVLRTAPRIRHRRASLRHRCRPTISRSNRFTIRSRSKVFSEACPERQAGRASRGVAVPRSPIQRTVSRGACFSRLKLPWRQ